MKIKALPFFYLLLVLTFPTIVVAQRAPSLTTADHHRYWLTAGFGKTSLPSVMGAVSFQPRGQSRVLTARYVLNGEVMYHHFPGLKQSEVGALYGVRAGNFIFSAGLSHVWGIARGRFVQASAPGSLQSGDFYEKNRYTRVGIPAEIRFLIPTKWVGIGFGAFGNLNNGHSYGGLNISFHGGLLE